LQDLPDIIWRKVLQHAVRENLIEAAVSKRQIAAIGHHVSSVYSELLCDVPSSTNALQRWVNSHRTVSCSSSCYAPSSPIASDFKEEPAIAPGKTEPRYRVFSQFADQGDVQAAICTADNFLHEIVDIPVGRRSGSGGDYLRCCGNLQGTIAFRVGLCSFRKQKNGNAFHDGELMAKGTM
jgi:hypothetical protein